MIVRAGAVVFGLVASMVGVAVGVPASAVQTVDVLVPLVPARILDTRSALGAGGPVGPNGSISLDVTGVGGVPADGVGAVVLNVTAAEATADTWLTVFPHGQVMPETSNLNVTEGFVAANLVVATVGDGGLVDFYNFAGSVELIVDVTAWLPTGGGYTGSAPQRVLDTRVGGQPVGPNSSIDVQLAGRAGVPASGVGAVVLSVTSTQATADTFLTVWPSDQVRADTSNLNPLAGRDASNAVVARLSADGRISVFNSAGSTHVIVDVFGWLPIGVGFTGLNPARILDTRSGVGLASPVGAASTLSLDVTGVGGVPSTGVGAVVLNLTATQASEATFVTAWPSGLPRPTASSLNPAPGGVSVANLVVAAVGSDGNVSLYNDVGNVHLIADVVGWFAESAAAATNQSPVAVDDAATTDEDNAVTVDVLANDTDADGDALVIGTVGAPSAGGSVVITGGGSAVSFNPGADFDDLAAGASRPTSFTYTVSDGITADTATVTVTVTGVADDPTAVADAATVAEGAAATAIDVLANDTDPDGGPKTIQSASDPANGTVAITGGGTGVTYQPDLGYCNDPPGATPDTFTYTLNGGSTATVSVTVSCFDDAPTAVDDAATVIEDSGANAIDVLANDTDPDAGPKTVISTTDPANGTVVITGGGTGLTYQPDLNYCNDPPGTTPDTFTYTLNGGSIATVSVTVTCVDDDPTAINDAATVVEDSVATPIDVLANDTDPDGGPKAVISATDPANGTVTITGAGSGLTYQPDANYCNDPPGTTPDTFTYTLNGGSTATVSVTVTCVDDVPTAINDAATVIEDRGANTVDVLANDTDPDAGPMTIAAASDPANGTVVLTGGSPGAHTGLTYQPDANYCNDPPGTTPDTFTYTLNGGSVGTVAVTVACGDDPPTAVGDTATVPEDSAATPIAVLANDTDIDGGPMTIVSASDPTNGTVVLTGGSPGAHTGLTYQPDLDYCNSPPGTTPDTFTYTLNGGSVATVFVTVSCGDDAPVAVADAATVIEDAAVTAIAVLANDTDVDGGPMTIAAASDPANGTVVLTGGGPGAHTGLTYQPDLNYCNDPPGTTPDTFTYTLNGGSIAMVSVTVTCVPDPATLVNSAGPLAYTENDPATAVDAAVAITNPDGLTVTAGSVSITSGFQSGQDVLDWVDNNLADSITEGASTAQTVVLTGSGTAAQYAAALAAVTYVNTSDNPSTAARTVTFAITVGVAASDTIQITVASVDDPPVAVNDTATVLEDAGAAAITVLANDTDPDGGAKAVASVTQPANGTVVITGGGTGLTYQPNPNYCNNPPGTSPDTFTYTLNGGSTATVSVTVTCVNDAPTAAADSFDTIGNTELRVDLTAASTPAVTEATATGTGVRGNDADHPAENDPFTVTSIVGCADIVAPYDCAVAGGTVSMTADGDFSFVPSPTLATATPTDTTFQYVITDQPTAGTPATATGTVTIHVYDKVWYVRQGASGNGTSTSPLSSFTGIAAGNGSDSDAPGDYIFVHNSGALSSSIVLEANQHLLGEGVALSINRNLNGNGAPVNLVAAGTAPTITSAANTISVTQAVPVEIRGLTIASTGGGGNAIDLTATGAFSGSASLTIANNTFAGATAETLDVNGGATGTLALTVGPNTWSGTHAGNGIDVQTTVAGAAINLALTSNSSISTTSGASSAILVNQVAGAITITDFSGNGILGSHVGTGVSITNARFDQTPGGGYQAVNGGALTIGAGGNGVGAAGLVFTNVSGDLSFTDLDVFADNGAALSIDGTNAAGAGVNTAAGTGTRVVLAGTPTLASTGGPAVNVSDTTITMPISSATVTSSPTTGISLSNVVDGTTTSTFTVTSGAISGTTGHAFNVTGSNATVAYGGTIANTVAAARSVNVTGNGGNDTISFTGAISGTGNSGILLDNNDQLAGVSTISFSGGITLNGTNSTFTATNGGTVAVTGTNTIGATTVPTGPAVNVANTTIGATGLTFRTISATGGANGIVLNTTGTSGSLVVTGLGSTAQGGDFSGGTIQNTTSFGISLTNTTGPSFRNMRLLNTGDSGVNGGQVNGFSFTDGTITGAGDASDENSITFDDSLTSTPNLIGVVTITNNVISQTEAEGIDILNFAGTITNATISNNALSDTGDTATPGSAISVIANGLPASAASITRAAVSNNTIVDFRAGAGIQVRAGNVNAGGPPGNAGTAGNATNIITITGNLMNGGNGGIGNQPDRFFTGGVSGIGQGNFNISSNGTAANRIRNIDCIAIEFQVDGPATVTSSIQNNFFNVNSAVGCAGMAIGTDDPGDLGAGTHTTLVSGNNVMGSDGPGIYVIVRDSGSTMTARVINNTVAAPIATNAARAGIRADSGSAQGDTTLCLEISGNTTAGSTNSGTATTSPGINLRKQGTDPAINTFGIEGMAATATPGVENYVNGLNTSTSGTFGVGGTALLSAQSGFTNCNAP